MVSYKDDSVPHCYKELLIFKRRLHFSLKIASWICFQSAVSYNCFSVLETGLVEAQNTVPGLVIGSGVSSGECSRPCPPLKNEEK